MKIKTKTMDNTMNNTNESKRLFNLSMKYVIPFFAYLSVPWLADKLFSNEFISYTGKVIATGLLLLYFLKQYKELKISFTKVTFFQSLLTGFVVFLFWVLPEVVFDKLPSWYYMGELNVFNPYIAYNGNLVLAVSFIVVRLIGAVIIAPVVEELFVRSFLMRLLIDNDFEKVKIGTYTLLSFIVTVVFFGFNHVRWIQGLLSAIIFNIYLYYKKDIFAVIQAHAWTNWFLAVFVLTTSSYAFW